MATTSSSCGVRTREEEADPRELRPSFVAGQTCPVEWRAELLIRMIDEKEAEITFALHFGLGTTGMEGGSRKGQ